MNFLGMGPMELMLILVLALIVFGPGKLPELGKALGESLRELRRAASAPAHPGPRHCRHCAAEVMATDRFCGGCGTRVAD